jgi:hypothetical protein
LLVSPRAVSTGCPHCNRRTDIGDMEVHGYSLARNVAICGTVTVFARGLLIANVKADHVIVHGKIQGHVQVRHDVTIEPGGVITAGVTTPRLTMRPGATLEGPTVIGVTDYAEAGRLAAKARGELLAQPKKVRPLRPLSTRSSTP